MATCLHIYDSQDEDGCYPVSVHSELVPRVGDDFYFWLDLPRVYPEYLRSMEALQPLSVEGKVSKVMLEYRVMRGWGEYTPDKIVQSVGVYLDDYTVKLNE